MNSTQQLNTIFIVAVDFSFNYKAGLILIRNPLTIIGVGGR